MTRTGNTTVAWTLLDRATKTTLSLATTVTGDQHANVTTTTPPLDEAASRLGDRRTMHLVAGCVISAVLLVGILFLIVTHFLGRRAWQRRNQPPIYSDQIVKGHMLLMEHQSKNKNWRKLVYHVTPG